VPHKPGYQLVKNHPNLVDDMCYFPALWDWSPAKSTLFELIYSATEAFSKDSPLVSISPNNSQSSIFKRQAPPTVTKPILSKRQATDAVPPKSPQLRVASPYMNGSSKSLQPSVTSPFKWHGPPKTPQPFINKRRSFSPPKSFHFAPPEKVPIRYSNSGYRQFKDPHTSSWEYTHRR
jgi:hypothetical protein